MKFSLRALAPALKARPSGGPPVPANRPNWPMRIALYTSVVSAYFIYNFMSRNKAVKEEPRELEVLTHVAHNHPKAVLSQEVDKELHSVGPDGKIRH